MIAINFTVFVELGLFLLFMWVTQRIILKPILSVMDRRDDQVSADDEAAEKNTADAESLERNYAEKMVGVRRASSAAIENARREGMLARAVAIRERKAVADSEVRAVEETASQAMEIERQQFEALVPDLTDCMARQLKIGGES